MVDSELELNRSPVGADAAGWLNHPFWVRIWQTLRHPILLLGVAGLLLALQAAALLLPQMPGQLTEDAVERARWLLTAQEPYGGLGALLAWLGLFDFVHSFVLRGLLAILILLVLVQLGDLLALVQRMHELRRRLADPAPAVGMPLPAPGMQTVYRHRMALPLAPAQVTTHLTAQIGHAHTVQAPISMPEEDATAALEYRWLRLEHLAFLYLRTLMTGALAATLILLWVILAVGWQADPPLLAPDASFRLAARDLRLSYQVTPDNGTPNNGTPDDGLLDPNSVPALLISVGESQGLLDVRGPGQLQLGSVEIRSTPADPALVVESWATESPTAALVLPGQATLRERVSLAFPSVGSEESVLIPASKLGVRLVRLPDANRFMVEVVSSATDIETQRTEINADDAIVVPYPNAADGELVLRFRYLPTLQVQVRSEPGDWLVTPLLALTLLGAVGLLRRPRFMLCQLAPWPKDRSVLVVQSDDMATMAALVAWAQSFSSSTKQEHEKQVDEDAT